MRRNIVRYAVLAYVITLQHVSLRVKKRFPTWQHMVDAGDELFLSIIRFSSKRALVSVHYSHFFSSILSYN